jgi:hypothetical protein
MTIVENCEIYEDEDELERAIEFDETADTYVAINEAWASTCSYTIVNLFSHKTFTRIVELETKDEVIDALKDLNGL